MTAASNVEHPSDGRERVVDLLLRACPSYGPRWEAYRVEPEFDAELLYLHLSDFAVHVVDLIERGAVVELPAVGLVLEDLHLDGDDYVKEAATIGLLESFQNHAGHRGISTEPLEATFGVETRRWWNSLNAFWAGEIPYVGADIVKSSG